MPRWIRTLLMALVLVIGGVSFGSALTACTTANSMSPVPMSDDGTPAPTAFVDPVTNQQCYAWVNNPHEADGSGLTACTYPLPTTQPVASQVGSDYALLNAMFLYHVMYHSFYDNPWYYNTYIGPAWSHYPGSYYGYGHTSVTRITNVNIYQSSASTFDRTYSQQEKAQESNAKYKTANGKTYTGKTVPSNKFSGTNTKPQTGGNAAAAGGSKSGSSSGSGGISKPGAGSGKSGFGSGSSGSRSGGSFSGGSGSRSGGSSGSRH